MNRYYIETWGCQMNVHDSEKMAGILAAQGLRPADSADAADLVLLNTCSVREKAAAKVFNRLGQLRIAKRARPDLVIGVCGCVAQVEGEAIFKRAPWVDLVMGPRNLGQLGDLLTQARRDGRSLSLARDDDPIVFPTGTAARAPGAKAYVTVMEGCNKKCAFCIVPYTRGREMYRDAAAIVAEVATLTASGYREIELLGQNVNAWHDGADDFAGLLHQVDRVPGVARLRFTTSHPGHLTRPIMEAMRDLPSICNHLHLPAQSGSDRILRGMRRGYTRAKYLAKAAWLRRAIPGMSLSTDLIVGFPGETEEDFRDTIALVEAAEFDQIYAFAYSPRPGTPAASAGDPVPEPVKTDRLHRLLEIHDRIQKRHNDTLVGRTFEVLADGPSRLDADMARGRTRCNRIVHFPATVPTRGGFLDLRIVRAHAHSLTGEPAGDAPAA
ncbi:MAG TPA: tRNA (N6-isopentenyl adenosine(37)-C2)-methylthiotransferase MiaB [Candidatus Polarisedimenticolia bacterium]|nr:tRNA (N6-isopentenyl adenosine(37)-C2)-methylthiotransferase MiaB [Candidatus Polarisedimenticolia bacterium]